jgi:hypothetical protein
MIIDSEGIGIILKEGVKRAAAHFGWKVIISIAG